jgi:hypothetical protein
VMAQSHLTTCSTLFNYQSHGPESGQHHGYRLPYGGPLDPYVASQWYYLAWALNKWQVMVIQGDSRISNAAMH